MGLFDRFKKNDKKQPTIENVTLKETTNMTPEELDEMLDNVPKTEEGIRKLEEASRRFTKESIDNEKEMFSRFEKEKDKAQKNLVETERRIYEDTNYLNQKINELQNLPGHRMANQIASEQARKTMREMEDRKAKEINQAKLDAFNKKYSDIIQLSKNKRDNDKWKSLPQDIKHFALIAFYEEKEACGFKEVTALLTDYELDSKLIEQDCGKQYNELNKRILLSMGILEHIGLLDIKNIENKHNPAIFENVIKKLDLSKYDGKDLPSIISSISTAIGKQNGKDGLLDEFFSDKLKIENYGLPKRVEEESTNQLQSKQEGLKVGSDEYWHNILLNNSMKLLEHGIPEEEVMTYVQRMHADIDQGRMNNISNRIIHSNINLKTQKMLHDFDRTNQNKLEIGEETTTPKMR